MLRLSRSLGFMTGEAVRINGKLVPLQLQLLCLERGEPTFQHVAAWQSGTYFYREGGELPPLVCPACAKGRRMTRPLFSVVAGMPQLCWIQPKTGPAAQMHRCQPASVLMFGIPLQASLIEAKEKNPGISKQEAASLTCGTWQGGIFPWNKSAPKE